MPGGGGGDPGEGYDATVGGRASSRWVTVTAAGTLEDRGKARSKYPDLNGRSDTGTGPMNEAETPEDGEEVGDTGRDSDGADGGAAGGGRGDPPGRRPEGRVAEEGAYLLECFLRDSYCCMCEVQKDSLHWNNGTHIDGGALDDCAW
mmetsp:Transcript_1983/g.5240  ORF Transcript_1983/g.5240 Transcript_1983/m.5240 type:complete len:147 (+) Transcript_1983:152-592(+)